MTIETALGLSFALFIFCLLPGPGVLAVTARSLASGFRPAMGLALGMTAGDMFYAAVAMLGLAAIGRILGEFFLLVKMAGVGVFDLDGVQADYQAGRILEGSQNRKPPPAWAGISWSASPSAWAIPRWSCFIWAFLPVFLDLDRLTLMEGTSGHDHGHLCHQRHLVCLCRGRVPAEEIFQEPQSHETA